MECSKNVLQVKNGLDDNDCSVFNVRIVFKGDCYGLDDCLEHEKSDPLIEFYDSAYSKNKDSLGYFVSRYFASTLLSPNRDPHCGLMLDTGHSSWAFSAKALSGVLDWAVERIEYMNEESRRELSKDILLGSSPTP